MTLKVLDGDGIARTPKILDDVVGSAGTANANVLSIQGIASGTAVSTTSSNLPTTVDTNSGNKSASTLRMVLATDQPELGPLGKVSERLIQAAFGTLTRPANTTAYSANDAISNNGTAGSVTAQTATISDVNDAPIALEAIEVNSTDTGLGGATVRAWLFNSDPTANTGVGGGDNAAFSQKKAGYIGTMSGTLRSMSDGAVGRLVPDEGSRLITLPVSGAKTIYILWQALTAFTPSANSTTIVATVEGWQGRA